MAVQKLGFHYRVSEFPGILEFDKLKLFDKLKTQSSLQFFGALKYLGVVLLPRSGEKTVEGDIGSVWGGEIQNVNRAWFFLEKSDISASLYMRANLYMRAVCLQPTYGSNCFGN